MGILLGPDSFTVGSDTNIDSYAGSPLTFTYNTGSGADIYVNAANDRIQGGGSPSPTVFAVARITNGTAPTADQAILGNYNASSTTAYPILTLRTGTGSGDFYAVYQYGTSFAIDRVTSYSFTNLFFSSASYSTGTDYYVRFRAIGTGSTVSLYLWINDTLIGTYADTDAARKTSGTPGVAFFYDTANVGYVDNLLIGDGAGIARINGNAGSLGNGGSPSVSMSGWLLEENDLVLAAPAIADNDNVNFTMAMTTAGYTLATGTDLFSNDGFDSHLALFYKFMGATPDTTVQMTGQGGTDASCALAVQVFRGVDTTTPFDVAVATATGLNTYTPNPPSCNHNAPAEAVGVLAACSAHNLGGATTYTFPTGYTTAPVQKAQNDTSDITVGMGYRYDPADPEDPGTLTHSGVDATTFSWCALTAVLRPVVQGTSVTPGTATLTITTFAPTVTTTNHVAVTPGSATLTLTAFAPTVIASNHQAVTPGTASLIITTFAPSVTVSDHQTVIPGPASLTLTMFAPTIDITAHQTVTPGTASITLTTFAPTVEVSGNVAVTPGNASLTLTAFAPAIEISDHQVVTPPSVALVLTTFAPVVEISDHQSVTPGTATLTLTTFAPTVEAGGNVAVTPGSANLTIMTFAPVVEISDHQSVTPGAASLIITMFAPTVEVAPIGTVDVTPGTASLILTTFPPTVEVSDQQEALPYGVPVRVWRELWTRPPMSFTWTVDLELDLILSGTVTYRPAKRIGRQKVATPVFSTDDRLRMRQEIADRLQQERSRREARSVLLSQQEEARRQEEDDEEAFTLAMMLLI